MENELNEIVTGAMDKEPDPAADPAVTDQSGTTVQRDTPDPAAQRAALVTYWQDKVRHAREFWEERAFKRMRDSMAFAAGRQWPMTPNAMAQDIFADEHKDRYVANITLRHINQRVAAIYGKNPKVVSRRKRRMLETQWDGTMQSLQMAMQAMTINPMDLQALGIVQDAIATLEEQRKQNKIGQTLEILFEHEIEEQAVPFKVQMKGMVRKALTCGVAYTKLGFQRVMQKNADIEARLADMSQQLQAIERLSADIADGEVQTDSAEAEQLRLVMASLEKQVDIIVREGLTFSYPDSTAVIPDTNTKQLRGWVGTRWAAEEYILTREQIEEIYNVDVQSGAHAYLEKRPGEFTRRDGNTDDKKNSPDFFCVWEVYNKDDGLVYVLCDGYKDFLREPTVPDTWLERFFPWFAYVVNEVYDDEYVFPPSDVELIRDMQLELNRARQGLREHRRAARPKTFVRAGALEDTDKSKVANCQANDVIELQGLQVGEKIEEILQPFAGPEIDPRLYDPTPTFEDYLRVLGNQEANLGGTSGATATEASIAEGSRMTSVSSSVDDLDEFLTELCRAGGQVLLKEVSPETVREVVGPGAVWPDLSRDQIAKELYLEIEAASTGRPNKQAEIQNAQQVFPLLLQIPGLSPQWLAKELLRRMDDRLDLEDAFAEGLPSIMMLNRGGQMAPGGAGPGEDPNQQGDQGANNAPSTDPKQVNTAPRPPQGAPTPGPSGPQPTPH